MPLESVGELLQVSFNPESYYSESRGVIPHFWYMHVHRHQYRRHSKGSQKASNSFQQLPELPRTRFGCFYCDLEALWSFWKHPVSVCLGIPRGDFALLHVHIHVHRHHHPRHFKGFQKASNSSQQLPELPRTCFGCCFRFLEALGSFWTHPESLFLRNP